jgi:hypothetical protein
VELYDAIPLALANLSDALRRRNDAEIKAQCRGMRRVGSDGRAVDRAARFRRIRVSEMVSGYRN